VSTLDRRSRPRTPGRGVAPRAAHEDAKAKAREAFVLGIVVRETETILELTGELDMASATLLRTEIEAALESDAQRVVLELSELKFIDSTGIRTLLNARQQSSGSPGRLTIRGAQGLVEKVLGIAGIDAIILGDS
jgi:anti-sigma B factor antagonist